MPQWSHPVSGRRKDMCERAELTSLIQVKCWDVPGKTELGSQARQVSKAGREAKAIYHKYLLGPKTICSSRSPVTWRLRPTQVATLPSAQVTAQVTLPDPHAPKPLSPRRGLAGGCSRS